MKKVLKKLLRFIIRCGMELSKKFINYYKTNKKCLKLCF